MKAAKTPKNLKEMPYPPQKKERKQFCASKGKFPVFINFFRTPKTNSSVLLNKKQRTSNKVWTTSRGNIQNIFAS